MEWMYTVGHSRRGLEEFVGLVAGYGVEMVADVRTMARSRHNPQFEEGALRAGLLAGGIGYQRVPRLGGLRRARRDSVNVGWRNASFRGYADYMETDEFAMGLEELEVMARSSVTTTMCAEAVPWRCHRSLLADALTVRGWEVLDIIGARGASPHRMTPFLKVEGGRLRYGAVE